MEDKGCTQVCKKCDKLWGTPTDSCFVKTHNLVEINEDDLLYPNNEILDDHQELVDEPYEDILQKDTNFPPVILIHVF